MSVEDEIKKIEDELKKTKYNKHTQFHIGKLKAKLARLRSKKTGSISDGLGYAVKKSGDATVIIVGLPSVGKSTLLNKLTNAESLVAEYDFTTLDVIPGVMEYEGAKIQMLDVPGIIKGVSEGRGMGRKILSVIRIADLILIILDANKPKHLDVINRELYNAGFRLNQRIPDVHIKKKSTGGIDIAAMELTHITKEMIRSMLNEFKIMNADVLIRDDLTVDELIDSIQKNRIYIPSIVILNKVDSLSGDQLNDVRRSINNCIEISAKVGTNIDELKKTIWEKLDFIRIYMKKIGKEPDLKEALVLKRGSTIEDVCKKIHRGFIGRFRYARIWGKTAKHPGQNVSLRHRLEDRDVVELHLTKV